jgi:hypothetical protein
MWKLYTDRGISHAHCVRFEMTEGGGVRFEMTEVGLFSSKGLKLDTIGSKGQG